MASKRSCTRTAGVSGSLTSRWSSGAMPFAASVCGVQGSGAGEIGISSWARAVAGYVIEMATRQRPSDCEPRNQEGGCEHVVAVAEVKTQDAPLGSSRGQTIYVIIGSCLDTRPACFEPPVRVAACRDASSIGVNRIGPTPCPRREEIRAS